jgi:hypothetical protein
MVLNKRRDVENGVRALLREAGLKVGAPSRKDFPTRPLPPIARCGCASRLDAATIPVR